MNLHEAKWWFVAVAFFALGGMWTYIVIYTYGTYLFAQYLLMGVITASTGLAFGRTARLLWDRTMPRAWKVRVVR